MGEGILCPIHLRREVEWVWKIFSIAWFRGGVEVLRNEASGGEPEQVGNEFAALNVDMDSGDDDSGPTDGQNEFLGEEGQSTSILPAVWFDTIDLALVPDPDMVKQGDLLMPEFDQIDSRKKHPYEHFCGLSYGGDGCSMVRARKSLRCRAGRKEAAMAST
jgi:hypothetical protein